MKFFYSLISICFVLGCRAQPGPEDHGLQGIQGSILTGKEYLWPGAKASVCWEKNLSESDWKSTADIRQKIAADVTQQYMGAGFRLEGWGECQPNSRGIRVQSWAPPMNFEPHGMVQSYGARLDGLTNGLGFYVKLDPKERIKWCQNEELCILGTALHEFGHAIGLLHSMNVAGSPCAFDQTLGWGNESGGGFDLPQYDPDSIMNYCYVSASYKIGRKSVLSAGDQAVIKAIYTDRPILPAEQACQRDGFSWVSGGSGACCRVNGQKQPQNASYPICAKDVDTSFASKFPEKNNEASMSAERLLSQASARITAELPWSAALATLSCWSGEVKGEADGKGFRFTMIQPSDPNFAQFSCSHVTFYNASGVNWSNKAVIFPQKIEIPVGKEVTLHFKQSEGRQVAVRESQLQVSPEDAAWIQARTFQSPPPMGIQGSKQVSAVQAFKFAHFAGKFLIKSGHLDCMIDGAQKQVISGSNFSEYDPKKNQIKVDRLVFNFPLLKNPAQCSRLKFNTIHLDTKKEGETTIQFKTPLVVRPLAVNKMAEIPMPACLLK